MWNVFGNFSWNTIGPIKHYYGSRKCYVITLKCIKPDYTS